MKQSATFPFKRARRSTAKEAEAARRAIEKATGKPRPKRLGRPKKGPDQKYVPISIRLHPNAVRWLKRESKRRGVGYQSLINQILLNQAA